MSGNAYTSDRSTHLIGYTYGATLLNSANSPLYWISFHLSIPIFTQHQDVSNTTVNNLTVTPTLSMQVRKPYLPPPPS
ncbi:hypothetical protein ZOSMA_109G00110 [Zostera marina]|uniref:Uncharacterized protein n=1 Tax=Zostera marina TaxID=29655 RepID=A0A0K9Q3R8_ZOSMR|nr:hypothetical protein ZOSMA_109G00110 [Zostera marina]